MIASLSVAQQFDITLANEEMRQAILSTGVGYSRSLEKRSLKIASRASAVLRQTTRRSNRDFGEALERGGVRKNVANMLEHAHALQGAPGYTIPSTVTNLILLLSDPLEWWDRQSSHEIRDDKLRRAALTCASLVLMVGVPLELARDKHPANPFKYWGMSRLGLAQMCGVNRDTIDSWLLKDSFTDQVSNLVSKCHSAGLKPIRSYLRFLSGQQIQEIDCNLPNRHMESAR